ncbi:flagellar protein FlhE [Halomonas urumqiensis]|uniref:Flagellar FlhE n=1 Tax=Halomonas urumqiensis TaxID=1684789 RepID=A0A2N7UKB5_9GAMM|nr:flagellar protein FlhE [Halomonas urumqiensis]PMR80865.1 flagellar FlhE [Halomonas urumqiensis]PTB02822.1 flagellar FlhE [Halomonas urumqiensis]GHE21331.1 flagellar protein FlhE [Halomonas urumqiensis]
MSVVATLAQLVMGSLVMVMPAIPAVSAGSWVAAAPSVRVVMAEREVASAPLSSSGGQVQGEIATITWQYQVPPGETVRARLCHADGCLPIAAPRGTSNGFAGMAADTPLEFRFALAPGQRQAVTVQGLQVIVNYR